MTRRINQMSIAAYTAAISFFTCMKNDIKNDERGLSGVVVAVLLILVAVLAIVMLWGSLSGWLGDLWTRITGAGDGIQGGSTL